MDAKLEKVLNQIRKGVYGGLTIKVLDAMIAQMPGWRFEQFLSVSDNPNTQKLLPEVHVAQCKDSDGRFSVFTHRQSKETSLADAHATLTKLYPPS